MTEEFKLFLIPVLEQTERNKMPLISHRGSRSSKLWILCERPYPSDYPKGMLWSGGMGFVLSKMLSEAGLDINDAYCMSRAPDSGDAHGYLILENDLNAARPPFLLALGDTGAYFLKELKDKDGSASAGQLQKYAGSLLQSELLNYPHYIMPIFDPQYCIANWADRNVTTYVDLQKMRDEIAYYKQHGCLQPLPIRELRYGNLEIDDVLQSLESFRVSSILSVDIETVYPRKGSAYFPHPGYPITVGIADNSKHGISFNLFRDVPKENRVLWRTLDSVLKGKKIIGQNFFNFDALFFEALGFSISLDRVQDTLLRHHILWPELSHKLQFLTRQYTREPFYKDDGHHWSIKHMDKLRRYNCLDVCVTMEVYEAQEEEFKHRSHLK